MGKNSNLKLLARFMALAVAHRVGQSVNPESLFAKKYEKEAINFLEQAKEVKKRENWNDKDKKEIKNEVKLEAIKELTKREHIEKDKFNILDEIINLLLNELSLS